LRYLAIDYGTKITGLALCDPTETIVSPLAGLPTAEKLLEKAAKKSSRIIADADLTELFGIDVSEGGGPIATVGSEKRSAKAGNARSPKSITAGSGRDADITGRRGVSKKKVLRKPKTKKKKASLSRKKRG
jgi:hypothetical protein